VPGVLIENNVHLWSEPLTDLQTVSKYLMHVAALAIARRCSRRAAAVIAETEEMKEILVGQRRLSPGQVEVVGLGVDHGLFRPLDRQAARQALGIAPDAVVLLYVGAMDEYHDLEPVIEALASAGQPLVQLHVVGDGEYRPRCEKEARDGRVESRFYGHVPHAMVPQYIAASDLCIAPYRGSACHNNVIPFSTLKIPEYMACARPVVSVPSGPIQRLIDHQVSGYIFPNSVAQWSTFLRALPARERLAEMGIAAAQAVASIRWDVTARSYLSVCERVAA
jgi:D-inositol-3-phosphate glycosyltransferase